MCDFDLKTQHEGEPDYDGLLRGNLERVFNERDPERRALAMSELFSAAPVMYEPDGVVEGRLAISRVAGALLEQFGTDFFFKPNGEALGHHGLGYLRWSAGPVGGPVVISGVDIVEVIQGRIGRLWVMLDPPLSAPR